MLMEHAADPDTLIHEWAESVIGDQYPVPDRIYIYGVNRTGLPGARDV